jgi:cytochrome P450
MSARAPAPPSGLTGFRHLRPLKENFLEYVEGLWREYGDAFRIWVGGLHINFFARPDLSEDVLVTKAECFGKPRRMQGAFWNLIRSGSPLNDGPEWPARRRLVNHALAHFNYEQLASAARRQTSRLILARVGDRRFNMAEAVERMMICTAVEASLGAELAPDADQMFDELVEGLNYTIELVHSPLPLWMPTRRRRRTREISQHFAELADKALAISRANRDPARHSLILAMDDLRSSVGDSEESIEPRLVQEEALMMIIGGKETAGPAAMWTTYLVAAHPEFQAAAAEEVRDVLGDRPPTAADVAQLKLLNAAYLEAIRLYPPAFIVLRETRRNTTIGGYKLAKGDIVCIYLYGIHRNAKWFEAPDEFRPERFLGDRPPSQKIFTPFGLGKRACPAAKFASVASITMLADILRQHRLEIPPDAPPVKPILHMGLRPAHGLSMRLVPLDRRTAGLRTTPVHHVRGSKETSQPGG